MAENKRILLLSSKRTVQEGGWLASEAIVPHLKKAMRGEAPDFYDESTILRVAEKWKGRELTVHQFTDGNANYTYAVFDEADNPIAFEALRPLARKK